MVVVRISEMGTIQTSLNAGSWNFVCY